LFEFVISTHRFWEIQLRVSEQTIHLAGVQGRQNVIFFILNKVGGNCELGYYFFLELALVASNHSLTHSGRQRRWRISQQYPLNFSMFHL